MIRGTSCGIVVWPNLESAPATTDRHANAHGNSLLAPLTRRRQVSNIKNRQVPDTSPVCAYPVLLLQVLEAVVGGHHVHATIHTSHAHEVCAIHLGYVHVAFQPVQTQRFSRLHVPTKIGIKLLLAVQATCEYVDVLSLKRPDLHNGGSNLHVVHDGRRLRGLLLTRKVDESKAPRLFVLVQFHLRVENLAKKRADIPQTSTLDGTIKILDHQALPPIHGLQKLLKRFREDTSARLPLDGGVVDDALSFLGLLPRRELDGHGLLHSLVDARQRHNLSIVPEDLSDLCVGQRWNVTQKQTFALASCILRALCRH
mmetsp:Transcript_29868/g.79464  ORF Transcript_29868/g.79464 Transcript_29868/m.79464 type:complete len:313 (+) Transcript_29868:148-1086(+)